MHGRRLSRAWPAPTGEELSWAWPAPTGEAVSRAWPAPTGEAVSRAWPAPTGEKVLRAWPAPTGEAVSRAWPAPTGEKVSRAWPAYLKRPSSTTPVVFCFEHRPGSLRLIFEVGAHGHASDWDRMYRLNLPRELEVQAGHEVDTIRESVRCSKTLQFVFLLINLFTDTRNPVHAGFRRNCVSSFHNFQSNPARRRASATRAFAGPLRSFNRCAQLFHAQVPR